MRNILSLTKRNCLLFLRSKQVVFYSLLSSIIVIVLYFLFIANLYSQGMTETGLSQKQINAAIYMQMVMGVMVLNSVSLSTGMFTFMARDFETRKIEAFLLTNTKPIQITLSYLFSALIVSFVLNFFMLAVSIIIIGAATGVWLGGVAFITIFGVLIITTVVGCTVMLLISTVARSSVAISVISGFIGTIFGFLCGIYMPYANMNKSAMYVGSLLPFTHLTVWLKQIALNDLFSQFGMPSEVAAIVRRDAFSAENVGLCGADVPLWALVLLGVVFSIICFVIAMFLISRLFKNTGKKLNRKPKRSSKNA